MFESQRDQVHASGDMHAPHGRVTAATEPTEARMTRVAWRTPRPLGQDTHDFSRFISLGASLPIFDS
jgi:hypothetical protein